MRSISVFVLLACCHLVSSVILVEREVYFKNKVHTRQSERLHCDHTDPKTLADANPSLACFMAVNVEMRLLHGKDCVNCSHPKHRCAKLMTVLGVDVINLLPDVDPLTVCRKVIAVHSYTNLGPQTQTRLVYDDYSMGAESVTSNSRDNMEHNQRYGNVPT